MAVPDHDDRHSDQPNPPRDPEPVEDPTAATAIFRRLFKPRGDEHSSYLDDMEVRPRPVNILGPLIAAEGVTILFADGGAGKSTIGLAACLAKATGEEIIAGLPVRGGTAPTVYLDWEQRPRATADRRRRMYPGAAPILYDAPSRSFADDFDRIDALVRAEGVGLVVADSIVFALPRVSIKDAEAAVAFCQPADALGVPVLALAHVTHEQASNPTMPFGSRFFHNAARMTWSGEREDVPGHLVRLVNRKANDEDRYPPMTIEIVWEPDRIELRVVGTLKRAMTLADRMEEALADGAMTPAALAAAVGSTVGAVSEQRRRWPARFRKDPDGRTSAPTAPEPEEAL